GGGEGHRGRGSGLGGGEAGGDATLARDLGPDGIGRRVARADHPPCLAALVDQAVDEVRAVLARDARDENPRSHYAPRLAFCSARSWSTIIATSSWNVTLGFHPSFSRALVASPMRRSTSAGRM